jgi:hypothetical protein
VAHDHEIPTIVIPANAGIHLDFQHAGPEQDGSPHFPGITDSKMTVDETGNGMTTVYGLANCVPAFAGMTAGGFVT